AELHSPDITEGRSGILNNDNQVSFDITGLKTFFVIRVRLKQSEKVIGHRIENILCKAFGYI
ncbi:MAG: hypothetical protein WC074_07550, partial [bacterium]